MFKKTMATAMIISALVLLVRACPEAAGIPNFDPKDPKVQDITIVNDALDTFIMQKDRVNVEKIRTYTSERAGKYSLLLMADFKDDVTMEKLEIMRQTSPARWATLQDYLNKSLAWLTLAMKAEKFLGGNLAGGLKKELGEK
jgi:hypothetical protein